jgi:hypothetical protein
MQSALAKSKNAIGHPVVRDWSWRLAFRCSTPFPCTSDWFPCANNPFFHMSDQFSRAGEISPHAKKSSPYMAEYFICTPDKSAATNETSIERKESADRFVNIAFDIETFEKPLANAVELCYIDEIMFRPGTEALWNASIPLPRSPI